MSPGVAAYHLARAGGAEPEAPPGFRRRVLELPVGEARLLEHTASGVKMSDLPVRFLVPAASPGQDVLLYHYTSAAAFKQASSAEDFWAALERTAAEERSFKDLGFGSGTYMSARDPEDFASQEAVLMNF